MNEKIIKSKKRTVDFGEVFTSKKIVQSMINLIDQGKISIESRFLEPACGDGNFLSEILNIKLSSVENIYKKNIYLFLEIKLMKNVFILQNIFWKTI